MQDCNHRAALEVVERELCMKCAPSQYAIVTQPVLCYYMYYNALSGTGWIFVVDVGLGKLVTHNTQYVRHAKCRSTVVLALRYTRYTVCVEQRVR